MEMEAACGHVKLGPGCCWLLDADYAADDGAGDGCEGVGAECGGGQG